jgi:hypothetical protein
MPNHIYNILAVQCDDKRVITKIRELLIKKGEGVDEQNIFDFNNIIPMPKYISTDEISYKDDFLKKFSWFDWRVENWDTKWNSYYGMVLTDNDDEIAIAFTTAWYPPMNVINKLFSVFDMVSGSLFYVSEFYNDLQGVEMYENGEVIYSIDNNTPGWDEYAKQKIEEVHPYIVPIIDDDYE